MEQHPAWQEEQGHLLQTLAVIGQEQQKLGKQIPDQGADVKRLHLEAGGMLSLDEEIAKRILVYLEQSSHNLTLSKDRPYFTRVDFVPTGKAQETHYIGKWGVVKSPEMASVVVDWRSPVANLYYAGQLGPVHYVAPDGEVDGQLLLKRQLDIAQGKLTGVFDLDIVSQDAYLQQALSQVSGDRLKEIVSTIQAEQNLVIRHTPEVPLIVQGVAGSGKTSIALHRVAWLLYAYQDRMLPEQMLILAPNPLFLDYISQVLPELGVEQVPQATLQDYLCRLIGEKQLRVRDAHTLESLLALPPEERTDVTGRIHFMGSLRFRDILLDYIGQLEQLLLPTEDLKFGPIVLLTREQTREILLTELSPFPLARRVRELGKYIKVRLKKATAQVEAWLKRSCEERVQALLRTLPDTPERRARMKKLYDSRDARIAESRETAKTFVKEALAKFPQMSLLPTYLALFEHTPGIPLTEAEQAHWRAVQLSKAELSPHTMRPEDLPALLLLHQAIQGLWRVDVRHLVVDEAQDISLFAYHILREVIGHSSITVVGDLMQGIYAYQGLESWDALNAMVFAGEASQRFLVTSYRNTLEIMHYAMQVAARYPVLGQQQAKPVPRHGPPPEILGFPSVKARDAALAEQTAALLAEGFESIAILGRDLPACRALLRSLPESLHARLLTPEDHQYSAGVLVIPAAMVKGLEFDAVLLADADTKAWPDEPLSARLLYVCLTRPLHRLYCYHAGERTPLLPDVSPLPTE